MYALGSVVAGLLCGYGDVDEEEAFWVILTWPGITLIALVCLPFYGSFVLGKLIAGRK